MALGQTITVVNKAGKVVSNKKHLVNVFKEAKSAYRERKAEIKALRVVDYPDKKAQIAIEDPPVDRTSPTHSRSSDRSRRSRRERPPVERGYSDSFTIDDLPHTSRNNTESSPLHDVYDPEDGETRHNELVRRHTEGDTSLQQRPTTSRPASVSEIDMDLAYGELPPPLPPRRHDEEIELRGQMSKLQQLLDEANCVQHSVIATIENLQKNPDALAAVALTLGEISSLASKMAPGALTAMKGSFPVIIALLASPQFMIAAGVGVGVTIIMLGGYKIIKKVKQRKDAKALENGDAATDADEAADFDELREINSDLSRIEMWRRGIAEAEATGVGTSVDGEFATPAAGRYLIEEGVLREDDFKPARPSKSKSKKVAKKSAKSEKGSTSSKDKEKVERKKEPSGLMMLFKKH